MFKEYSKLAVNEDIQKAIVALKANGIDAEMVKNGQEAKSRVLALLPQGVEVMNMSSVTIDTLGLADEINNSSKYDSVRNELSSMNRETQGPEMQKLGTAPQWAVGSVNAVTKDGKVLIASNSGSQLPAYVYGSSHVIWVVGAQKLTENLEDATKRIYEYVLPLEDARSHKAYGVGSNVSKLLIVNKEVKPSRIHLIFVNEALGF